MLKICTTCLNLKKLGILQVKNFRMIVKINSIYRLILWRTRIFLWCNCDVLLTVHLSIFILVINQLDAQNLFYDKFISCLYMFRAPCAHRQEVKIVLYSLWYYHTYRWPSRAKPVHGTATYRCDDTRGCIIQFWPPDDEHMVLETCIGMK